MKKSIFYIDGGKGYYIGYTSGETWNGWSMPWLSKSETMRMLENEDLNSIQFEWQGDELIETFDGDSVRTETITIDGELYYQVGNGWVWDYVWFDDDLTLNVRDISGRGGMYNTTLVDYACANIQDTDLVTWLEGNWTSGEYLNEEMAEVITIVYKPTHIKE
jgi:hypothetical protein